MPNTANVVSPVVESTVRGLQSFALVPPKQSEVVDVLEGESMSKLQEAVKGFVEGEKAKTQGENQILTAGVDVKSVMDQVKPLTYEWFMTVSGYWKEQYMKRTGFATSAADMAWSRFLPAVGVERPKAKGKAADVAAKREAESARLKAIPDIKKAMAVAFKAGDNKHTLQLVLGKLQGKDVNLQAKKAK